MWEGSLVTSKACTYTHRRTHASVIVRFIGSDERGYWSRWISRLPSHRWGEEEKQRTTCSHWLNLLHSCSFSWGQEIALLLYIRQYAINHVQYVGHISGDYIINVHVCVCVFHTCVQACIDAYEKGLMCYQWRSCVFIYMHVYISLLCHMCALCFFIASTFSFFHVDVVTTWAYLKTIEPEHDWIYVSPLSYQNV